MSTFKQFEHKPLPTSTPAAPTSSLLRPSRRFAPLPTPASQQVPPVTQAQLDRAARFGHSFDRISLFPPVSNDIRMPEAGQLPETFPLRQKMSMKVPSSETMPQEGEPLHGRFEPTQNKENETGLPDTLKAGIESLSGMSMDDVKVHYHSPEPAQVQALAYTQGTTIHVGPGRERHLAHEAWHVVQQKQGRVKPTLQAKGVAINDDARLEREADIMGARASQIGGSRMPTKEVSDTTSIANTSNLHLFPTYTAARKYNQQNSNRFLASTLISDHATLQRKIDEELKKQLESMGYKDDREYMSWTGKAAGEEDVDWKAHIGVAKENRKTLIERVAPILQKYGISHKFEVTLTEALPKFLTIYPPLDPAQWAPLLSEIEGSIGNIATISEQSTEAMMQTGKIGMRHGQITALTLDKIKAAGISIKEKKPPENYMIGQDIQYYTVEDAKKLQAPPHGELAWVGRMRAFFFLFPQGRPQAAVIWEGTLRADPRETWNPLKAPLPPGVSTFAQNRVIQDLGRSIEENIKIKIALSENRVSALVAKEQESLQYDPDQLKGRQDQMNREYARLGKLEQEIHAIEQNINSIQIETPKQRDDLARYQKEIPELKTRIQKLYRTLDVAF